MEERDGNESFLVDQGPNWRKSDFFFVSGQVLEEKGPQKGPQEGP